MGKRDDSLLTGAVEALRVAAGSFKTRYNHIREAQRFIGTLRATGFGVQRWEKITNKHVAAVVNAWRSENLKVATIKEYLSGVRRIASHFGNNRIARENSAFGLENRIYVTNRDKSMSNQAYEWAVAKLRKSSDENHHRIAVQLMIQRTLGLRKEESFKFNPHRSVLSSGTVLVAAGTKGGRERMISTISEQATNAIEHAKSFSSGGNTMAPGFTERQWNSLFYRTLRDFGISKVSSNASAHGLRHAYAQERYRDLTGYDPPVKFASRKNFMENAEKIAGSNFEILDREARAVLKAELGHGQDRDDVVSNYLGSSFITGRT